MPFTVQQLIETHQGLVTVSPQDTAQKALALMAEHDFSQLPVVDEDNKPLGIVTGVILFSTRSVTLAFP